MRFTSKTILFLAAGIATFLFTSDLALGQTVEPGDGYMVVEIEGLNPQGYSEIVKSSRQIEGLNVKLSCIPANLILFSIDDLSLTSEYWAQEIKTMIVQSTALEDIHFPSDFTEEDFNKKCSSYRMGIPIE